MNEQLPADHSAQPISFGGSLDYAQFRQALHRHLVLSRVLWPLSILSVLFGMGAFVHAAATDGMLEGPVMLVAIPVLLWVNLGYLEWKIHRAWKTDDLVGAPVRGTLTGERIEIEGSESSDRLPWDRLHQWDALPSILLLYRSDQRFNALPKEFFRSTQDWERARRLASEKLPSRRSQRLRSLALTALLWSTMVAVALVLR